MRVLAIIENNYDASCIYNPGKYLNNYAQGKSGITVEHIPPGWDRWYTLVGNRYLC